MKRAVIMGIFLAILLGGIYYALNRKPDVDIGKVEIIYNDTTISLDGYKIRMVYGDNVKMEYKTPVIMDLVQDMKIIKQSPSFLFADYTDSQATSENKKSTQSESSSADKLIKSSTDSKIVYKGNYTGDILYSFYDLSGNILAENQKKLEIPTGEISDSLDGCIIQIDVNWGRSKNYMITRYFFKCIFE